MHERKQAEDGSAAVCSFFYKAKKEAFFYMRWRDERSLTQLVEAQECIIVRNNFNLILMRLEVDATCSFCSLIPGNYFSCKVNIKSGVIQKSVLFFGNL